MKESYPVEVAECAVNNQVVGSTCFEEMGPHLHESEDTTCEVHSQVWHWKFHVMSLNLMQLMQKQEQISGQRPSKRKCIMFDLLLMSRKMAKYQLDTKRFNVILYLTLNQIHWLGKHNCCWWSPDSSSQGVDIFKCCFKGQHPVVLSYCSFEWCWCTYLQCSECIHECQK